MILLLSHKFFNFLFFPFPISHQLKNAESTVYQTKAKTGFGKMQSDFIDEGRLATRSNASGSKGVPKEGKLDWNDSTGNESVPDTSNMIPAEGMWQDMVERNADATKDVDAARLSIGGIVA